jgi:hypothetical protein
MHKGLYCLVSVTSLVVAVAADASAFRQIAVKKDFRRIPCNDLSGHCFSTYLINLVALVAFE